MSYQIMDFITKFVSKVYQWILQKISSDDVILNDNDKLPQNFYDIYYHFKVLEKEGRLYGTIVENFNYPDSFTLTIPNTSYEIKITNKDNKVFTSVYVDGTIQSHYLVSEHETYASLEEEVYIIGVEARTVDV